ncbi:GTP cyclohydrolase II [uncultured Tateyamaria sp.]|uniref:GTP cyclohydrolase II n=1 Tax=uncultured Tateyamaria sp. TaxID=455651 RepID=UPI002625B67F|nr:GTP cyclohydrolase II [uncultured Tateyamaria sp.]
MGLAPDITETLARARADLRMGVPIVLLGAQSVLAVSAETVSEARLQAVRALEAAPVLALTDWRAKTLRTPAYDGDMTRIRVPDEVALGWLQALADPADDLAVPMKGPLQAVRGGDVAAHRVAIQLCKSARLLPAALCVDVADGAGFAAAHGLTAVPVALAAPRMAAHAALHPIIQARLPIQVSEAGRLHVFRPEDGGEEHYAIEIGRPDRAAPVLARLHSACFTGDVLGSQKCDCGPQLNAALAQMGAEGTGVLLYLNQEGRGIGLANKMRAYALQDQGFDTVEANHRLGFEDDERDFRIGSDILARLGFSAVRLMTNNPAKVAMMEASGLRVAERVPLRVGETAFNRAYLATKAAKSGHLL